MLGAQIWKIKLQEGNQETERNINRGDRSGNRKKETLR